MRISSPHGRGRRGTAISALTVLAVLAGAGLPQAATAGRLKPPKNTALPVISGTPVSGEVVTVTPGTWTNGPATPYAYQWLRCDSAGSACVSITGATGTTYLQVGADVGHRLRVRETATNTAGSGTATSAATSVVAAAQSPANTQPPTVSGEAVTGETLAADPGTWTGAPAPALTYQWQRCGATCSDISGATARSYVVTSADEGSSLRVVVTGSNTSGSVSAASAATATVVAPSAPVNVSPPAISGTLQVGATVQASTGTWSGSPTPREFAYQWRSCDTACTDISGATSSSYRIASQDAGRNLQVAVTATSSGGSTTAVSQQAGPVEAAPVADPVIAAAGDIACDPSNSNFNGGVGTSNSCRQMEVSDLLVGAGLKAVLALGDNQYYCGGLSAFQQAYDPSWGRVKDITYPSVGNHEYLTSGGTGCDVSNTGAAGYWDYFGAAAGTRGQGWYSFDVGAWHIIALNSNCGDAGGCGSTSAQGQWLRSDLAAHTNACTLAFWHIPLFSSGGRASSNSQSFWDALYSAGADVVLNGHDHIYERFAPQTPSATVDNARGIREFIVGTGGANHTSLTTTAANSEVRDASTYGVLKMTLHANSYDWQFTPEAGRTFTDSGTTTCH
jgi:hypothetical protein